MHSLEPVSDLHSGLLHAAALGGCDINIVPGLEQYIGYGDTKHGHGPACLIDLGGTPYLAEPHVTWFPWTNTANRIANFKWAMRHLAKTREVMLVVEKREKEFFDHFVKRGLLRKIGHITDLPEPHEEVHMYQYKRQGEQE